MHILYIYVNIDIYIYILYNNKITLTMMVIQWEVRTV